MLTFPRSRTPPSVYPFPEQLRGSTDSYRSPREGIYDLPLAYPSSNDGTGIPARYAHRRAVIGLISPPYEQGCVISS